MLSNLFTLLKAIPEIIKAISSLAEFIRKNNLNRWLGDLSETIDELGKAETIEAKRNAAKKLSDLTGRL